MNIEEIKKMLEDGIEQAQVMVDGDGYHYQATIISELFVNKSKVQRQQLVYEVLGSLIRSGELHALSMRTLTPQEWEQDQHG